MKIEEKGMKEKKINMEVIEKNIENIKKKGLKREREEFKDII